MDEESVRERQINLRLSEEEAERLELLSAHYGLNPPNLLRFLLKKESDALRTVAAGSPPTAPQSPKKKRARPK